MTAVTFTADINAFIVLFVLVEAFSGGNGQITVFQFGADVLFFEARQVDIHFISGIRFLDIGFHNVLGMFAVQRIAMTEELFFKREIH